VKKAAWLKNSVAWRPVYWSYVTGGAIFSSLYGVADIRRPSVIEKPHWLSSIMWRRADTSRGFWLWRKDIRRPSEMVTNYGWREGEGEADWLSASLNLKAKETRSMPDWKSRHINEAWSGILSTWLLCLLRLKAWSLVSDMLYQQTMRGWKYREQLGWLSSTICRNEESTGI